MPENCAKTFMNAFFARKWVDMACIDELCDKALSKGGKTAAAGVKALYGSVIEGLCDDFSDRGVDLCNQVLLRILFNLLLRDKLFEIDKLLTKADLTGPQAILRRYAELRRRSLRVLHGKPKCFLVLSRVTIGADVMITSIIVQRLRLVFPEAQIVLIGPAHLEELFSEQPQVHSLRIPYRRNCSLVERIAVSGQVHKAIARQSKLLGEKHVVLVDPDSRLSQLGLMPLMPLSQSRYFCSRQGNDESNDASLVHICNRWLDQWLGGDGDFVYPSVFLGTVHRQAAANLCRRLRHNKKHIVVINLGVGSNEKKRVGEFFEEQLLLELLRRPGLLVVLDSGSSPAGLERVRRLIGRAVSCGHTATFLHEEHLISGLPDGFTHDLVGIRSSIGLLGAMIAEADCFFGYDSCCQHLAAATGAFGVVVFAGHPSERFLNRWRPLNSRNSIEVLSYGADRESHLQGTAKLVEEVALAIDRKLHLSVAP